MPTVADKTEAVERLHKRLQLVDDLLGGTDAMRKAGETHLPKWPLESSESYTARIASSVLFPAFKRTVITLAAKPFSKPLTYGENVPERIKDWCENDVDMQGRNLHALANDAMQVGIAAGLGGLLVDYPSGPPAQTQQEEKDSGRRPYILLIKPGQLLGWRYKVEGGQFVFTMLRFIEEVEVDDDSWAVKCVKQVRVLEIGRWQTWREVSKSSADSRDVWSLHEEGEIIGPKVIPFAPFYGERLGFMDAKPPLYELAHMNVEHWQSASDQRVILHVARVPILVATGVEDSAFEVVVGASGCVKLPEKDSDLKFVEHTGAAIEAGQTDLDKLEERMRQAGAELLIPRPNQTTAFQVASENAVGASLLEQIALTLEDALDLALQFMADFAGEATGGNVTLFSDWSALTLAEAGMADLTKMQAAGTISKQTLFEEAQRRSILSADREWDDEQDRIDEEGPALGAMGVDPITGEPTLPAPGGTPPGGPGVKPPFGAPPTRAPKIRVPKVT